MAAQCRSLQTMQTKWAVERSRKPRGNRALLHNKGSGRPLSLFLGGTLQSLGISPVISIFTIHSEPRINYANKITQNGGRPCQKDQLYDWRVGALGQVMSAQPLTSGEEQSVADGSSAMWPMIQSLMPMVMEAQNRHGTPELRGASLARDLHWHSGRVMCPEGKGTLSWGPSQTSPYVSIF